MITNSSPFAGLSKVILVIALITAVAAAALSGTDIFNFITNSSKAKAQSEKDAVDLKYYQDIKAAELEAASNKAKVQSEKDIIDLKYYEDLKAAELEAAKNKNDADLLLYAEKARSDQAYGDMVRMVVMVVAAIIVIGLAMVLMIGLFHKIRISIQANLRTSELWRDPHFRALEVQRARQTEQAIRATQTSVRGGRRPARPMDRPYSPYDQPVSDLHLN